MKRTLIFFLLACSSAQVFGASQHFFTPQGEFIIPESSIEQPGDAGKKMHTNLIIFKPDKSAYVHGLPGGETPASIACIYGFTAQVPGCPINGTTALPTGGWGAIAVIENGDNPNAENDLNVFSRKFGLPDCTVANGCFDIIYETPGTPPPPIPGSQDEHVLDIEWAHAMAPNAKIIMAESNSDSIKDLMTTEALASQEVQADGGGAVSNSWSMSEFAGENSKDTYFQTPGIVYFGSSGDYGAPARYPSSSPYVVSCGGTRIDRDSNGNFIGESAWSRIPGTPPGDKSGSSGGPSIYEPRPAYQNSVAKIVGAARGTPDISFDADPTTGVDVYSTYRGGWFVDGGTSVSSPALAGIVNAANLRMTSTTQELTYIYANAIKNYHSFWHDILVGENGGYICLPGYDLVTGLGSVLSYNGK